MKEYLFHLVGVVKEELDGRNSPWKIREILSDVRSSRGTGKLQQVFSECKLRRNQTVGSKSTRIVGSLMNSHFGDSKPYIKIQEIMKYKVPTGREVPLWG
jgi:hypothetical protein